MQLGRAVLAQRLAAACVAAPASANRCLYEVRRTRRLSLPLESEQHTEADAALQRRAAAAQFVRTGSSSPAAAGGSSAVSKDGRLQRSC